ncbi:UDP-glucuronate 4-epimerase 6 [Datura stramonium]|uniref:UDP-glucuronate 4-epimerase 6 n=1 Tax=Datura stramonium TaxID=4076 RepID=A0ABS8UKE2_DATST|nr:UDP-glucuronate 4-epimerase 6 [Datura stramonium]
MAVATWTLAKQTALEQATVCLGAPSYFLLHYKLSVNVETTNHIHTTTHNLLSSSAFYGGGASWEKQVRHSSTPHRPNGLSVLVTGAAGFVGSHCSLALKKRGDGVLGIDNFNSYYDPSLKRARQNLLSKHQIFIVEADNDAELLKKLFDIVPFTHILHLAAQAGVRYAMQNPLSYVNSNVAGFVNLLEIAKAADPQPAIASFVELGLRIEHQSPLFRRAQNGSTGEKSINVYVTQEDKEVARDFTYIDDIAGCVGALDTAEKSTEAVERREVRLNSRVYNLGNTSPVSVRKLVAILENLLNVKAKKNVIKMPRNGDVPFTHANVSLAL